MGERGYKEVVARWAYVCSGVCWYSRGLDGIVICLMALYGYSVLPLCGPEENSSLSMQYNLVCVARPCSSQDLR